MRQQVGLDYLDAWCTRTLEGACPAVMYATMAGPAVAGVEEEVTMVSKNTRFVAALDAAIARVMRQGKNNLSWMDLSDPMFEVIGS